MSRKSWEWVGDAPETHGRKRRALVDFIVVLALGTGCALAIGLGPAPLNALDATVDGAMVHAPVIPTAQAEEMTVEEQPAPTPPEPIQSHSSKEAPKLTQSSRIVGPEGCLDSPVETVQVAPPDALPQGSSSAILAPVPANLVGVPCK